MASLISLTGGSDDIMMAIAFERFGSSDLTTAGFLGGSHDAAQRRRRAWGVAWRGVACGPRGGARDVQPMPLPIQGSPMPSPVGLRSR